jgi:predicted CXXCH cytochrome family protein
MKKSILLNIFLSLFLIGFCGGFMQADSCIDCHKEMEEELLAPVEGFKTDVHQRYGLTCTSCHGGNSEEEDIEMAKDSTFKGSPKRSDIPEYCGECHSNSNYMRNFNPSMRVDQLEIYWTSEHGQLLKKGDTKTAVCIDCHGTHGILEATHPRALVFPWNIPDMCGRCHSSQEYMQGYGISTTQLEDYSGSVHANALFEKKDLSAPVCNDCHGNHGAKPPQISSISFVCRQCHPSTSELFSQSPHKEAYEMMEISECEACHQNHKILPPSDEMLGTGDEAVCIQCHEPDSIPYETASAFKSKLDSFKEKIHHLESMLRSAEQQGVEVSEPEFKLREVNTLLILSRNLTHSLNIMDFEENIREGDLVLEEIQEDGEAALAEAKARKSGLAIVTFFILLLAIALFLKIKQIEKQQA